MVSVRDGTSLSEAYPAEIAGTGSSRCSCLYFWRLLQLCNTALVITLFVAVFYEYSQIQTLQSQIATEEGQIGSLLEEVREKQEGQIEELHQEVQEEHKLTFLTLTGTFTLLTCLISMFHMSSHLQKMVQPIIQRKIVAILWMSPIYSVTSFLSLLYQPLEGYLAIVKDFYESYCIYTFLSFLIAVLGKGSREKATEVLAMHASHLEKPTRCLKHWYDPPPETSDKAKANAVITQCQIFAMQFVFIRPLTAVISFIYHMDKAADGGSTESGDNTTLAPSFAPLGDVDNNGTRWLQDDTGEDLPLDQTGSGSSIVDTVLETLAPTLAPVLSYTDAPSAVFDSNGTAIAPTLPPQGTDTSDFGEATLAYFTSFGFVLTMIVNVSVFFAFWGLLKFYHAVRDDLTWCRPFPKFLTIKGVVFLTFWQGLAILIYVHLTTADADGTEDASQRGKRYQNILICLEMLFFSITHWCVFPAEEWEKDYQPPEKINKPGIGLQDFVSDVGQIVNNGRRRRKGRRRRNRRAADYTGFYRRPASAGATFPDEELESESSHNGEYDMDDGLGLRPRINSDSSSARADDEQFTDDELL